MRFALTPRDGLIFFAGIVVADLFLIGADLFAYGMHWREQWRS